MRLAPWLTQNFRRFSNTKPLHWIPAWIWCESSIPWRKLWNPRQCHHSRNLWLVPRLPVLRSRLCSSWLSLRRLASSPPTHWWPGSTLEHNRIAFVTKIWPYGIMLVAKSKLVWACETREVLIDWNSVHGSRRNKPLCSDWIRHSPVFGNLNPLLIVLLVCKHTRTVVVQYLPRHSCRRTLGKIRTLPRVWSSIGRWLWSHRCLWCPYRIGQQRFRLNLSALKGNSACNKM